MHLLKTTAVASLLVCTLYAQQTVPDLKRRDTNPAPTLTLPSGTDLHLALDSDISTETAKVGEGFSSHLVDPVVVEGTTVIPAGTVVRGRIKDVSAPGRRFRGKTTLTLRPETIIMGDGTQTDISALMTDTYDRKAFKLDSEGSISNSARHYTKMSMIGGAAGSVGGFFLFGPYGALYGAGIGAALPAARWGTKDDQVTLDKGTAYWFEISRPATLRTLPTQAKTETKEDQTE